VSTRQYLTTEQVCGRLDAGGVDEATVGKVFAARLQPQNLDDPDHLYTMGCTTGDPVFPAEVYLVVYKFGLGRPLVQESPLDEGGPDWRPRWVAVEGPYPGRAPDESAKDFKARIGKISEELTSG
jgi:hypothetical protein